MGCCQCKCLSENDRKEGKCSGALYYCKEKKKYVNGNGACDEFTKDYGRSSYITNEIYDDGRKFYDDDKDPGTYLIILIILIIMAIIVNF